MLTPREQQMVSLLVEGHSNGEIAKRLRLKRQTVKNQLATIYQKVGVTNRVQLAVLAVRHNLI
jgi:DNA-binding NarL/FixJ family response regulator